MSPFDGLSFDEIKAKLAASGIELSPEAEEQIRSSPEAAAATAALLGVKNQHDHTFAAGRPVRQAITVRARWKKGATTCNLLAGKSNVLVECADGTKYDADPHLPARHAFFWSAVELVPIADIEADGAIRFLNGADFSFSFYTSEFLALPAVLLFGGPYEVGFTNEQGGLAQRPDPAAMLQQLAAIGAAQREDGDEWKDGDGHECDDEASCDHEHDPPTPDIAGVLGPLLGQVTQDPRAYHPVQIMPLEIIRARLVSETPAPNDIDLVFVMHGVLIRPVVTPTFVGGEVVS